MKKLKQLFHPFPYQPIDKRILTIMYILQFVLLLAIWYMAPETIPKPHEILASYPDLFKNWGLYHELETTFLLCIQAMGISIIICLIVGYLSTVAFFALPAFIQSKFRYNSLVGLSMLFMLFGFGGYSLKLVILVFGISGFLILSIIDNINTKTEIELYHARTIESNSWMILWEVIILGKRHLILASITQTFAIAWGLITLVENLVRSGGGLGVLLYDSNKYLKYDKLLAIQILVITIGILIDLIVTKIITPFICPYIRRRPNK